MRLNSAGTGGGRGGWPSLGRGIPVALCLALLLATAVRADNLVANGDFEEAGFTGSHIENCGSTWLKQWTCSGAGICMPKGTYLSTAIQSYNNSAWAFLKRVSYISQDIAIATPGLYRLTFDFCGRPGYMSKANTAVTFGETTLTNIVADGTTSNGSKIDYETLDFVVDASGTYALKFAQTVSGDLSPAVDNISLTLTTANLINIIGNPSGYGSPTPGYGFKTDVSAGTSYTFSVPKPVYTNDTKTIEYTCTGWTLRDASGSVTSGPESTVTVSYAGGLYTLTWNWAERKGHFGSTLNVPSGTYPTIASAIEVAQDGDTVLVADGLYEISDEINVTNRIALRSENGKAATEIRRLCTQSGSYAPSTPLVERCVRIANADAVVDGFTISGGSIFANSDPNNIEKYGAGVLIAAAGGTLQNCSVTNCCLWRCCRGGGIAMGGSAGVVSNCVVTKIGITTKGNYPYRYGVGVYMTAGLFTHGEVSACDDFRADNNQLYGRGMYVSGGRVSHSRIVRNAGSLGVGLYVANAAVTVDNCLIAENENPTGTGDHSGGGVYARGGTFVNCTIVKNRALQGGGICINGNTHLVNCVISDNEIISDTTVGAPDWLVWGSNSTASNNLSSADFAGVTGVKAAVDNLVGTPIFTGSDYALAFASPGVDAGTANAPLVSATDFAGRARVSGPAIDIGCHEFRQTAGGGADFSMSITNGVTVGTTVTFTAKAWGAGSGESYQYRWDFGDGWTAWSSAATATKAFSSYGTKTVKLQVTFGSTTPEAVSRDVYVSPVDIYVVCPATHPSQVPVPPYATAASAATNIVDALAVAADGSTVHVGAGTYEPGATLVVTNAVTLVGDEGREVTVVNRKGVKKIPDGTFNNQRCVTIDHASARVKGFTFWNGYLATSLLWDDSHAGAGAHIGPKGGTLDSCAVTNCAFGNVTYGGYHRGGGVGALGPRAVVTNCLIKGNSIACWIGYAGGVYMTGGAKLLDSTIDDNRVGSNNDKSVGNVYATGPCTISRCRIQNASVATHCGGIQTVGEGALVDNCLIVGNAAGSNGGGVYATAGTYRNCTVVGNSATTGGGVWGNSAKVKFVNCILEDNSGGEWSGDKIVFTNCITTAETLPTVYHACVSNTAAGFTDAASGDYTLKSGKVAGANIGWNGAYEDIASAKDLALNARLFGDTVDTGCYEYYTKPGTVVLTYEPESALPGQQVTFTIEATLQPGQTPEYRWLLDGEVKVNWSSSSEWITTFPTAGAKTVRVEVRAVGTTEPVYSAGTFYAVIPETLYVVNPATHPEHVPVAPYVDWNTAATSVLEAVAMSVDGCTVIVGAGDYTNDDEVVLSKAVTVVSQDGPASTTLRRRDGTWSVNPSTPDPQRVAHLTDAGARLEGFTLTGGHIGSGSVDVLPNQRGAGVLVEAGTLSGCIVTNNLLGWCGYGAGVAVTGDGGVVTNCIITKNASKPGVYYYHSYGLGVHMSAGLVTHCDIVRNDSLAVGTYDHFRGIGVHATGGTLRKCRILENSGNGLGGEHRRSYGVVYSAGDGFRCETCLIAENDNSRVAYNSTGVNGTVYAERGTYKGCTVVANTARTGGGITVGSNATLVNCIFDGNAITKEGETATNYTGTAKSVSHCATRDASMPTAGTNVIGAVAFRNPSLRDYAPKSYATVVRRGLYDESMEGDTDLAGVRRATPGKKVDIGAYQATPSGVIVIFH